MLRWQEIKQELQDQMVRAGELRKEWEVLKEGCVHPNLPKRQLGTEYMDTCPDCGAFFYSYRG